MMNKRFKIGERVVHYYLGEAMVKDIIFSTSCKDILFYLIITDKKPPVRYNMGQHDCLALPSELSKRLKGRD